MKKIELYTFIYNDEDFLPFFLKYYSFVDRMTFIDSGSNDDTLKIINKFATPSNPIVRLMQTGLETWDHEAGHAIRNSIWKDSNYDLVMFPDLDEIFYYPDIRNYLDKSKYDIYEMEGFEMVSDKFPAKGYDILSIKKGVKHKTYNKSTIFNPKIDIVFPNAHLRCSMNTNVCIGEIKLLHYRNLGIEMMKKRRDREASRLPQDERVRFGRFPHSDDYIKERHDKLMSNAINVI
jgi:hypothetical protein